MQFVKTQKKLSLTWQQALAPAPDARKISIGSSPSAEAIGAHSVAAVVTATAPETLSTSPALRPPPKRWLASDASS